MAISGRPIFVATVGLAAAGCAGGAGATTRPAGQIANPDYMAWTAFAKGSYSVVHHQTVTSGFAAAAVQSAHPPKDTAAYDVRTELTGLTPDAAQVTITVNFPRQVIQQTVAATVDAAIPIAKAERDETLTVGGVDYDCQVFESRSAQGMAALAVTSWVSPKVPGGIVKIHTSRWAGPIHVVDDGVLTQAHVEK